MTSSRNLPKILPLISTGLDINHDKIFGKLIKEKKIQDFIIIILIIKKKNC